MGAFKGGISTAFCVRKLELLNQITTSIQVETLEVSVEVLIADK